MRRFWLQHNFRLFSGPLDKIGSVTLFQNISAAVAAVTARMIRLKKREHEWEKRTQNGAAF